MLWRSDASLAAWWFMRKDLCTYSGINETFLYVTYTWSMQTIPRTENPDDPIHQGPVISPLSHGPSREHTITPSSHHKCPEFVFSLIHRIHPYITKLLFSCFFPIELSIAGRRSRMKSRDRQATFISCVSRWCLKWLSCLSPSPALSHIFCSAFHYLSIKLSNSAVWFAACLSSPHLLHHFHFLCWNLSTFLTHGRAKPNLSVRLSLCC